MKIILNELEQEATIRAAKARLAFHVKRGSKHRYGKKAGRSLELEINSIGAEIAVARVVGRTWEDKQNEFDYDGDVGEGIQVRQTTYSNGRLILHDEDNDDHLFFLAIGRFPIYNIPGWIKCLEGKRIGKVMELQKNRPAICVEQEQLNKIKEAIKV